MRGRRWLPLLAVAAAQVLGMVMVATLALDDRPHGAPLTIVAPAVVGQSLVARADATPGRPLDATVAASRPDAERALSSGTAVAVVVVDLAAPRDVLLVPAALDPDLRAGVVKPVRAVSASLGRRLDVREVGTPADGRARRAIELLPVAAVAVGIAAAVALTWWRGPVARSMSAGAQRVGYSVGVSLLAGGVLAAAGVGLAPGGAAGWFLVLAVVTLAATAVTQALESIIGVWGLAVALSVLLLTALPALAGVDSWLQVEAWRTVAAWLPHAAGTEALRSHAVLDGSAVPSRVAVLGAWTVVSLATAVLARAERHRVGATVPGAR